MGCPGWPHGFTPWVELPTMNPLSRRAEEHHFMPTACGATWPKLLALDGHRVPQVWWPWWPEPVIKDPRGTQCHQRKTRMSNSKQVHTHLFATFNFHIWHHLTPQIPKFAGQNPHLWGWTIFVSQIKKGSVQKSVHLDGQDHDRSTNMSHCCLYPIRSPVAILSPGWWIYIYNIKYMYINIYIYMYI